MSDKKIQEIAQGSGDNLGFETVSYSFDEQFLIMKLNDVELYMSDSVILYLEMICAKARYLRNCRQNPGIVSKASVNSEQL